MLCRAYTNQGVPCKGLAKVEDLCKLHSQSQKRSPIKWEISQSQTKITFLKALPLSEYEKKYQIRKGLKKIRQDDKTSARIAARVNFIGWREEAIWEERFEEDLPVAAVLPAFHEDNQNVHRTETVDNVVKANVSKMMGLKIYEPRPDFAWNTARVSKTIGEIIMKCSLSPAAALQLLQKYISEETIYDMVPGIYGKVLDRVWLFCKKSGDFKNLKKILSIELQDSVGMCAQGNLSRLCNVPSGYIEDISRPPVAEILGELLPPLTSIVSLDARYTAAVEILRTHNVPEETWNDWLEPLEVDKFPPFTIATGGRL